MLLTHMDKVIHQKGAGSNYEAAETNREVASNIHGYANPPNEIMHEIAPDLLT